MVSRFLHSQGSQSAWNVPPPDFLKINMDASYCKLTQTATMAIIVRDSGGRLVVGFCFSRPSLSALAAETMALLAGVCIAKARGFKQVIFESDSKNLIDVVNHLSDDIP